jgi:hypothetical protein
MSINYYFVRSNDLAIYLTGGLKVLSCGISQALFFYQGKLQKNMNLRRSDIPNRGSLYADSLQNVRGGHNGKGQTLV